MKVLSRLVPAAAAALAAAAFAAPAASASTGWHHPSPGAHDAVFVQTDNLGGNAVIAYHRARNGALTLAATYPTGGLGGQLTGSVVDHLASQGSLTYSSGGSFPVSVTVHGDVVYVLNALGGGSVYGYRVQGGQLSPIPGSLRGLDPSATPQFTHTPGQVAFTPGGSALLVTTKANGTDVDVFAVGQDGLLSSSPAVNSEPGAVPFAVSSGPSGDVLIAEAGPNALVSFSLASDGVLTVEHTALTGQAATCWVAQAGQYFYASNAGSGSVSGYQAGSGGQLTALGNTSTDAGTVDAAGTPYGRFLYVQAGGPGAVDEFAVGHDGSLTKIGSVTVAGAAGGEGIAAS